MPSITPVPNTPLVSDPSSDAIWKRWLQGLQSFLSTSVSGPSTSTDNAVVRFNGTNGLDIQSSSVIIDDSNNVTGVVTLQTSDYIKVGTSTDHGGLININTGTTAADGVYFGSDVTLYRSAANTLKTDDSLVVAQLMDLSGSSAGQVKFPATQNASADVNTLDDYEEGSFTPTLVSSGGGTPTYSVQVGRYTKIGNRVLFNLRVKRATVSTMAAGNVTIGGLPFTSANITDCVHACAISASNLAATVAYYDLQAVIGANSSVITLYDYDGWGTGNRAVITTGDLNTLCEFEISGHYIV